MERIKKWFENGCQYLEGIRLYESLPRANKLLITRFKKKHTTTNLEKLQYELKKQLVVPVPKPVIKATPVATLSLAKETTPF